MTQRVIEYQPNERELIWRGHVEGDQHERLAMGPYPATTVGGVIEKMNRALGDQPEEKYDVREHAIAPQTTAQ